ncbi:amidase [Pseudomonas sp. FW306-02-F02-AA]|uniref:nicotinamidase n=1 Tax=Pseudomonas fluorescens TaxID=294 RepID=A0A0N9VS63_PSEFL|nr:MULTISPECIES: isochorismatase family protein [Pseudomonas]ALI03344.1 amidase [Pseudomonas fluorescens]PMZ00748.1 amidase [Pseudomonas sp. FW306-02-F02-AB]PMZ07316.1 amidase [Pseudomonas sp. FW306-02-H06C]PMZ13072.1 amidase [Pseudomonas sp. FW306-02-F02-AA]PMZ18907.1 amidase [Pseudomonas sp. FW306-02-F08-AA]
MNSQPLKTASFDVDAQKSFTPLCPDELPVAGGEQIGSELNFMATLASLRVGSKDAHTAQAPWVVAEHSQMFQSTGLEHADITWVSHCVPGTEGFTLLDELPTPYDYDYFVWKGVEPDLHPYGACYHDLHAKLSTGVIEYLNSQGVKQVIVGGLALDFCVKTTALQLAAAGFKVIIHLPACRAISEEGATQAIQDMQQAGISVTATREETASLASA